MKRFFSLALVLFSLTLGLIFFFSQLVEAKNFPMWEDELFGLQNSMRQFSYFDLLIHGANGQGSPSPLDYLAGKFFDQIKVNVHYFGFAPEVYFRIFSNSVTTLVPFLVVLLLMRELKPDSFLVLFLISCVSFAYYSSFQIYKYAHELRPYALWTALYFTCLIILMTRRKKLLFVLLLLLALTATASLFQIGTMAISYFFVHLACDENTPKENLAQTLKLFGVPILVSIYYLFHAERWNYPSEMGAWNDFFKFWSHYFAVIPLMLSAAAFAWFKKETRPISISAVSFLLIYLMGPVLFWLTKARGFFYADRQYMYYEFKTALFMAMAAFCAVPYLKKIKSKQTLIALTLLVSLSASLFVYRPKHVKRFLNASQNTQAVLTREILLT